MLTQVTLKGSLPGPPNPFPSKVSELGPIIYPFRLIFLPVPRFGAIWTIERNSGVRLPRLGLAIRNTAGMKEGKRELRSLPTGYFGWFFSPQGGPHFWPVAHLV